MVPGGLRMGSPALTSRGFVERDFDKVAEFVDRAVAIAGEPSDCAQIWRMPSPQSWQVVAWAQ